MKKLEVAKIAWKHSVKYNIDFAVLMSVIKAESNFDERAVSSANCRGLMQLGPQVGKDYKVKNLFDPDENISVGCKYLQWLEKCFRDSVWLTRSLSTEEVKPLFSRLCFTLAAYNWGIGNVAKLQAIQKKAGYDPGCFICAAKKLPEETKNYVLKILMEVTKNVMGSF